MTSNNRSASLAAIALAATALLAPGRAGATLTQTATFDEKVENAASVILGRVVKQESRFDPTHRWILTYTTFSVEKSIKGGPAQEMTIVTPGGHVGNLHQDTPGIPEFSQGEEKVLFVRNSRVGPTVLYFDQGAYDVKRDERGNRIVMPVETEAVSIDSQRGKAVVPEEAVSVDEFEGKVRAAERRIRYNQMELLRQQQRAATAPSFWETVADNAILITVALAGLAFATWRFLRR